VSLARVDHKLYHLRAFPMIRHRFLAGAGLTQTLPRPLKKSACAGSFFFSARAEFFNFTGADPARTLPRPRRLGPSRTSGVRLGPDRKKNCVRGLSFSPSQGRTPRGLCPDRSARASTWSTSSPPWSPAASGPANLVRTLNPQPFSPDPKP